MELPKTKGGPQIKKWFNTCPPFELAFRWRWPFTSHTLPTVSSRSFVVVDKNIGERQQTNNDTQRESSLAALFGFFRWPFAINTPPTVPSYCFVVVTKTVHCVKRTIALYASVLPWVYDFSTTTTSTFNRSWRGKEIRQRPRVWIHFVSPNLGDWASSSLSSRSNAAWVRGRSAPLSSSSPSEIGLRRWPPPPPFLAAAPPPPAKKKVKRGKK